MKNTKPELNVSHSTIALAEIVAQNLRVKFIGTGKELHKVSSVERHKKRFDNVQDIKKEVSGTGCIRITAVNVQSTRKESGYTVGSVKFVAFIMTNDQYGQNRDQRAELIAGQLGVALTTAAFNLSLGKMSHKAISSASWQNLTTHALDDIGVAMWAVEWSHECRLNVPLELNLLDDFLTCELTALQAEGAPQLEAEIALPQE